MSKEAYHHTLERRLAQLDGQIDEARQRLETGAPADHVAAAGELRLLEDKRRELQDRLHRLDQEPEGTWEDFKTSMEDLLDEITVSIERWFKTH